MITNRLSTRWTTQQALFIAEFLDEVQESLWENYKEELIDYYRLKEHEQGEEEQLSMAFDDIIPF